MDDDQQIPQAPTNGNPQIRSRRPANRRANTGFQQGVAQPAPQPPPAPQPQPPPAPQPQPPPAPQPQHPQERPKLGVKAIKEMLLSKRDAIQRIIPQNVGLTVDGLIQNALQQIMRDRRLAMCTPYSVLDAVLGAAAVGLDLVADQAYLVAHERRKQDRNGNWHHEAWACSFWPGYKGMITVAARYGWALDVQEVRANDEIDIAKGTENRITHKVKFGNRGETIGVYCVVRDRQHRVCSVETMDMQDIAAVRKDTAVWREHEGQMARKSVVRRVWKYLPKDNGQMRLLAEVDDRFEEDRDISDLVRPDADLSAGECLGTDDLIGDDE